MRHVAPRLAILLPILLALLAPAGAARAGAWTQEAGHGQVITTFTYSGATRRFDDGGRLRSDPRFAKYELSPLVEYGLTPWATIGMQPRLQRVINATAGGTGDMRTTGAGESDLFARFRIYQDEASVVSIQPLVVIPGNQGRLRGTQRTPRLGTDEVDVELRALYGRSLTMFGLQGFTDQQLAFRKRTGRPADEIRFDSSLGVRPRSDVLLLGQVLNTFSVGHADLPERPLRAHKLQLSAVYDIDPRWSLQVGGFSTLAGRNNIQENALFLAVWRRF